MSNDGMKVVLEFKMKNIDFGVEGPIEGQEKGQLEKVDKWIHSKFGSP